MISASQRPAPPSAMTPASWRRMRQCTLGDESAHAPGEAAQAHLPFAQRTGGVAAGSHARLHALDQRLVLGADAAVDAPVEVANGAHFAARIRMHVSDLADHGLGG